MSTTIEPRRIASRIPPGPVTTASTSGESETMMTMISERAATSAGDPATSAPREARTPVLERVRLKMTSG